VRMYRVARTDADNIYWLNKVEERSWFAREATRYPMHPVIEPAVLLARPRDWHQLLLEHPHVSEGDRSRIAYTQSEAKGKLDRQTVTSVGKYLMRHFDLPDHVVRDLVARHGSPSVCKFVHTTAEMIHHLHRGPGSCMVWREDKGVRCSDGVMRHPYEVYNPKYGWHMAVRTDGDETVGRALCMTNPDTGYKYYVRTYAKPARAGGYSETDNAMENWLTEQGYSKEYSWQDGEKLAYFMTPNEFLAPFLDGGEKRVSVSGDCLVVDSEGVHTCDQTGGSPTEIREDVFECEDCGDETDDDDGYWVGRFEDSRVCCSCQENNYRYAYSRNGDQYYIHEDYVVWVESQQEYYDMDRLSDNNIVQLENGEYEHMEEAVEIDGEWYMYDDERICRTEDTDEYELKEDCWQCEESGNWYTEDTDYVEVDGNKYHPDDAPDQDDDEDDDDEPAPEYKMLTLSMIDEAYMSEDYTIEAGTVRFSISILHNGIRTTSVKVVSMAQIAAHGIDLVRVRTRAYLSSELLKTDAINAKLHLESTSTI